MDFNVFKVFKKVIGKTVKAALFVACTTPRSKFKGVKQI